MSNPNTPSFPDFGKLVPGFDFLQNLVKQAAGSATQVMPQLPNLGNWIAPTFNVEELDKRVQELKAVQFWLDQNAAALKATIQALEVQKMTLATLKGMNFNMGDVANAFKLKAGDSMAGTGKNFPGMEVPASTFQANKARADAAPKAAAEPSDAKTESGPAPAASPGMADPMQWWDALTQQFQAIAAEALKEVGKTSALDTSKHTAKDAVKTAADMTKGMAQTATKAMTGAAMNAGLGSSNWPKPAAKKAATGAAGKTAAGETSVGKSAAPKAAEKSKAKAPARKKAATAARKTTS
jgi:hypothetical protein